MLINSVGQEFRESTVGWFIFTPQCLCLPQLGRLLGWGLGLPEGVIHSLACLAWAGMTMGKLSLDSPCGLAFSEHGGLRVGRLLTWRLRALRVHVPENKVEAAWPLCPSLGSHVGSPPPHCWLTQSQAATGSREVDMGPGPHGVELN